MVKENPCEFLKSIDMYGPTPTFTFKGRETFQTWVGTISTILAMLLFLSFSLVRTVKLISGDDPFLSMITLPDEEMTEIDLAKL